MLKKLYTNSGLILLAVLAACNNQKANQQVSVNSPTPVASSSPKVEKRIPSTEELNVRTNEIEILRFANH